jgi:hypothetical protein
MEDVGMWRREGEREVKEPGGVECFLRDHTEKMTYRLYAAVAKPEMR